MRFSAAFRFEFSYQLRRPWPWLIFAALVVLAWLVTRDNNLAEALYEDFFINSPFSIAKTTVVGGLLWLMMAASIAGEAAARDVATSMYPLTYTLPASKAEYLGGRFLAALVINAVLLLAVQLGIVLAVYLPGVDSQVIGPFRLAAYLNSYLFLSLPNVFVGTAIQFALATRSGRPMNAYLGSLALFFTAFFIASALLFRQAFGTLLDPIGVRFVLSDFSHLWTTTEKSWRLVTLEGTVLYNRLLWIGVALLVIAVTWLRFQLAHRTEGTRWWRRKRSAESRAPVPALLGVTASRPIAVPRVPRVFTASAGWRQALVIGWDSFRTLANSWPGRAFLVGIPLLGTAIVVDQMVPSGVPLIPETVQVLGELTGPLSAELSRWVFVPLLLIYFAGELVWRERDAGLGEIADTTPVSDWVPFLGKLLGLALLLVAFKVALTAAGVLAQVILGYHDFEPGLYLKIMFGLQLPEYLLFAVLALALHGLVNQKYVGHMVAIIAYVLIALAPMFGLEHNLLIYGAGPGWNYTDMRGFGTSIAPWAWFKLYWAAWALLLAVIAGLFWVRGREGGLATKFQLARIRFTRPAVLIAGAAAALILALGGFIFYNTNVLNRYRNAAAIGERGAEYEHLYGRYAGVAQPVLTAARLHVDIHPRQGTVDLRGTYHLVNHSVVPIDTIHVAIASDVETRRLELDRPSTQVLDDDDLGHRIFALQAPLQPGDSLRLAFQVQHAPHGFRENGVDPAVVPNGTSFSNSWLPAIGYQSSRELISAGDRRKYGLAPRRNIPSLDDEAAREQHDPGITFEAIVSTDEDQVGVAPGALRRTWTENGRRFFDYATDGPIGSEWTFYSADYAVREAKWNDSTGTAPPVAIRIYHNPRHTVHVDRMVRSIKASLDYYTRHFGPYQHSHLTIVERPPAGIGLHADATLISHGEGFPLWNPEQGDLDLPFAVVAHEMGHQWGVPYASVEGAPVMSESIAWYYGMKATEHTLGFEQLRRLMRFFRDPYPYEPIRRGEPLLRGLDPWMSYRKGPFTLYAMSEYIGEEQVNAALRRLREKHEAPDAGLATTLDLYAGLQAVTPDSLKYLLHDLFEVNTWWELETLRASAEPADSGTWLVTLDVRARKTVADSAGVVSTVPMDELVEVGVFAAPEAGQRIGKVLYQRKHRIQSGEQVITVTVPGKPFRAGLDPYHLLDLDVDDNTVEVKP